MKKISQFLSQFLDTNLLCPSFLFSQHVSCNHCKITDSCFQNSLSFSPDLTEKQRLRGADGASPLDIQKKKKKCRFVKESYASLVSVTQSCPTLCNSMDCSLYSPQTGACISLIFLITVSYVIHSSPVIIFSLQIQVKLNQFHSTSY